MKLIPDLLRMQEPGRVCREIEMFVKGKVEELNREGVILGLSGGIDSALVAYLSVGSIGPDKVIGLYMPDKDSEERSGRDARRVADELGIRFEIVDLTPILTELGIYRLLPTTLFGSKKLAGLAFRSYYRLMRNLGRDKFEERIGGCNGKFTRRGKAYSGTKHRLRMLVLQKRAETDNLLVVGAANKSEYLTGVFVQFGCDHLADLMPLIGLYKTQVRQLAAHLRLPKEILTKSPTPDLLPGIKDEDITGPYQILDLVLLGLGDGLSPEEISVQLEVDLREVERIRRYTEKSASMRESPYVPNLSIQLNVAP